MSGRTKVGALAASVRSVVFSALDEVEPFAAKC